ncbi:MAG TPA: hypothetical protein P5560_04170 [Thermotogota bacterium]|nr:hypothetical protein [Thermotogota bacterium]HRW92128.1 hypothetical protein [Thermotogota bacterium]
MRIAGSFLETFLAYPGVEEKIRAFKKNTVISLIDHFFDSQGSFIFGAPSLHLVVETFGQEQAILVYLDMKSTTFSFQPDFRNLEMEEAFNGCFQKFLWAPVKAYEFHNLSMRDVINDLQFFNGFNLEIWGFAATSNEHFEWIESEVFGLPMKLEEETTLQSAANAFLINALAVESHQVQKEGTSYLVPSVGVDGLELWLGTNSAFFVELCRGEMSDAEKKTRQYLFNMVFSRICFLLSQKYTIAFYSVSKLERGFFLHEISPGNLKAFLQDVRTLNRNALSLFQDSIVPSCGNMGGVFQEALRKFEQLSNFYDEKNFINLVALAFSESDAVYQKIANSLLHVSLPALIESLGETIQVADQAIQSTLQAEENA